MSRPARALIDANVFVAAWTLDILLTLADRGAIEPVWSEGVLVEAREAVNRVHGTNGGTRYIAAAERAFPYAMAVPVEEDFAGIVLPDPDDRHVVAAALAGGCDVIVTYNVKDFPADALAHLGLRALRPDDFLMEVAAADSDGTIAAVKSLVAVKKRPPRTMKEELAGLRANMLDKFACFIERSLE